MNKFAAHYIQSMEKLGSRWRSAENLPKIFARAFPDIEAALSSWGNPRIASGAAKRIVGEELRNPGAWENRVGRHHANLLWGDHRKLDHPGITSDAVEGMVDDSIRGLSIGKLKAWNPKSEYITRSGKSPTVYRGTPGTATDHWATPPDAHFSDNAPIARVYAGSSSFLDHKKKIPSNIGHGGLRGGVHIGQADGPVDWRVYNKASSVAAEHPTIKQGPPPRNDRGYESQLNLNPKTNITWNRSVFPISSSSRPAGRGGLTVAREVLSKDYQRMQKFFDSYRKPLGDALGQAERSIQNTGSSILQKLLSFFKKP